MTEPTVADCIRHLQPCESALTWAAGYTDPVLAWKECRRGDWMLWLLWQLVRVDDLRQRLIEAECACAQLVLTDRMGERSEKDWRCQAQTEREELRARQADVIRQFFPDPPEVTPPSEKRSVP